MKQMNLLYFSLAQGVSRLSSCITEPNTRGSTSQLIRKRDPLHISAFFYSPPQHTAKCRPSNCPSDALSWSGGPQIIWVSTTFDLAQNLRLKRSWLLQVFLPHTKLLVNILHVCPTSLQIRSWVDTAEAITALCKVRHQVIHVENNLRARKKEEEKMGGKALHSCSDHVQCFQASVTVSSSCQRRRWLQSRAVWPRHLSPVLSEGTLFVLKTAV